MKKVLTGLWLLLLAASIAGNLGLYRMCRTFYLREAAVRLDPLGLGSVEPVTSGSGKRIVFFGDSRAQMWDAPVMHGFCFNNHGIGGQTTEQIRLRVDSMLEVGKPEIVVLEAGINDLKYIPLMPGRGEGIAARTASNLRGIVRRLSDRGVRVVVCTVFPCGDVPLERALWWSPAVDEALARVNREIAALEGGNVMVLDAGVVLSDSSGKARKEFQKDLLHYNEQAYSALNRLLAESLASRGWDAPSGK